jgi:hypothetical protein
MTRRSPLTTSLRFLRILGVRSTPSSLQGVRKPWSRNTPKLPAALVPPTVPAWGRGRTPRQMEPTCCCHFFQRVDIHGHSKQVTIDSPEPHAESTRVAFLYVDDGAIGFDRSVRQQPALSRVIGPAAGTVLLPDRSRQRIRTGHHQVPADYHGSHRQEISP